MRLAQHVTAAGLLLTAVPAAACSVMPGYTVPTAYEMALKSDAIIIAEVNGELSSNEVWGRFATVKPIAPLKGKVPHGNLTIDFSMLATPDYRATPSDPRELRAPNPGIPAGSCWRYVFDKGMKLVLFLVRDKQGALAVFRSPFARDAEDVADDHALWVKAVREFAKISLLPEARRKRAMRARIAKLNAAGDPDSRAIAADMVTELKGRH